MKKGEYMACGSSDILPVVPVIDCLFFDCVVMLIIETAKFTVNAQHTNQNRGNFRAANYAVSALIHGVNSFICNG